MAGLIDNQMPEEQIPAGAPPPEAMAEPMPEQAGGAAPEELDPESAAAYKKFTLAAQQILYEGDAGDKIAEQLAKAKDGATALSEIAYELVTVIDEKSGGMLPDELLAPAAFDVLGMVAEIAQAVGQPVTGINVAHAAKLMIGKYLQENGATDDELDALMQGVDLTGAGAQIDAGEEPTGGV